MRKFTLLFLFTVFAASALFAQEQKISERLQEILAETEENDFVRTMVILDEQVDVYAMDQQFYREEASLEERTYQVITTLKRHTSATQKDLIAYLRDKDDELFRFQPFWVVNMVVVEAKPSLIYQIAAREEVYMVDHDGFLARDLPVSEGPDPNLENGDGIESVEPGVKIINADKLWEIGITGAGRIVMGIDTGVDVTHPALSYKWRGNHVPADQAWFDANQGSPTPTDCDSHGTHTMGTMTGRTASDTVGVAIDAEWIAAKTICSSPHTSNSVAAFQWAMDPDNDPTTIDDMPDAITNSWWDPGISNECNSIYKTTLDAVEAVGIAVVFSAGNSGPSSSSITTPKNINTDEVNIWATGAISGSAYLSGSTTPIASFSSRGPSTCGGTGSLLIKPEASAPGVSVRSSVPGNGYGTKSGTSMAAPHVSGAIALLKQFAPQLTGKQIKMALYNTAEDLGTAGEDNTYGTGLIDVYAAFLSLGTPDQTPPDPIVDLQVVDPTSNSLSLTWTVPYDSSQNGVTAYDVRYSLSPIADTNDFNNAMTIPFTDQPKVFGETELMVHEGLDFSTQYYFAIRCMDIWGNVSDLSNASDGTTYDAPVVGVNPPSLSSTLSPNEVKKDTFYIENTSPTNSTLDYEVSMINNTFPETSPIARLIPTVREVEGSEASKDNPREVGGMSIEGSGGPDTFGYEWIDSDEPNGPTYEWNDISTTGTEATSWTATGSFNSRDEGYAGPFSMGFSFKFYGEEKTEIYVSSNGFLTFDVLTSNSFTNDGIPDGDSPNNLIAPIWDDLDGKTTGKVYYQQDGNKFIVQYEQWPRYSGGGTYTYQAVLYSTGKIMYYYKDLTGTTTSATVGIENADGTDGLQIAHNSGYLANDLAVKISADPDWLASDHMSGRIYNGNTAMLEMTFRSEDYPAGNYSMDVVVSSNDPVTPEVTLPVEMTIDDGTIPVELSSFNASVAENIVELVWMTATETNNQGFEVERKRGEEGSWEKIGYQEGRGSVTEMTRYRFEDKYEGESYKGKVSYRLKQIDLDGSYEYVEELTLEVDFSPQSYELSQNYPNPFNPVTKISYALPEKSEVKVLIYSMLGEKVAEIVNVVQESGYYEVEWNGSQMTSGVYIYSLQAKSQVSGESFSQQHKMVLMK